MQEMTAKTIDRELQKLVKTNNEKAIDKLNSIIKHFPNEFSDLIEESFLYKRIPKEYMLSAILFTISTATGLTFFINALGYKNYGNCYFTIIGSRGDSKTEAIKTATKPLKEIDDLDYENYLNEVELSEEKETEPKRKQVLIQDASIEAAHKVHSNNPNSIGIAIDEIYALVEKMSNSNSRDGIAWRNFLLEGYTNGHVDISRKTTQSFRINETCPTLLGGLQHQFVPKLFANGNLESGFIDRQLFTTKLTHNKKLIRGKLNDNTLRNYQMAIKNIMSYKRQCEKPEELKKQFEIVLSENAEQRIFEYTQELINRQSNSKPVIKEYMSKMQISIQKLCVLVFIMKNALQSTFKSTLTIEIVELAIEINEFYFLNFCDVVDKNFGNNSVKPTIEGIISMAKMNNASQKAVVEVTGLHKGTISKKWNKV